MESNSVSNLAANHQEEPRSRSQSVSHFTRRMDVGQFESALKALLPNRIPSQSGGGVFGQEEEEVVGSRGGCCGSHCKARPFPIQSQRGRAEFGEGCKRSSRGSRKFSARQWTFQVFRVLATTHKNTQQQQQHNRTLTNNHTAHNPRKCPKTEKKQKFGPESHLAQVDLAYWPSGTWPL